MSGKTLALLSVLLAAILGCAVSGITKKGLAEIPPYSYTFLRFVVASLCVLLFLPRLQGITKAKLKGIIPISSLAIINVLFFVLGVNLTTANVGSVIYAAVPLLTAVILFYLHKQRLSLPKEIGLLIGFLGVLLITLLPLFEKGNPFAGNLFGNMFLAIAVICWSFYMVFSRTLQETHSPLFITSIFVFLSTIIFFPFFLSDFYTHYGWWEHVSFWGIFSVVYTGVIATVVNYLLIQYAIKHGGAVLAGMMFYIIPILAVGINFILLGELLTPGFIVGGILALLGTYLVVKK